MYNPNVKWAAVVGVTIFACLCVVAGGIVYGVKISADTERACIQSDRVWVRSTCLDNVDDTRYIED